MADSSGSTRRRSFWAQAASVAAKDLRIEWHSREVILTMGFLAVLMVLVFAFAFVTGGGDRLTPPVVSGILWVTLMYSGTVALARSFDRERDNEAIRALLLSPAPRAAIFIGKLTGVVALMVVVQTVVALIVGLMFSARMGAHPVWMGGLLGLGTLGYASVGVVFSAALVRARSRDALLSALLLPLVIPVLITGVRGTTLLLDPATPDMDVAVFWTRFLALVDLVFFVLALWAFEPVVTGD